MKYVLLIAEPKPGWTVKTALVSKEVFEEEGSDPMAFFNTNQVESAAVSGGVNIVGPAEDLLDEVYESSD